MVDASEDSGLDQNLLWTDPSGGHVSRRPRSPWELPEVAAVALLAAVAALMLSGLAAGFDFTANGGEGSAFVGAALLEGTDWADIFSVLLLLASLGLVWWQIQGWTEALEAWIDAGADETDDTDEEDSEPLEAIVHLGRARRFATWSGILLVFIVLAEIAKIIGLIMDLSVEGLGTQVSPGDINEFGDIFATFVVGAAVLVSVFQLRRLCNKHLAVGTGGDEDDFEYEYEVSGP